MYYYWVGNVNNCLNFNPSIYKIKKTGQHRSKYQNNGKTFFFLMELSLNHSKKNLLHAILLDIGYPFHFQPIKLVQKW
jgi:hypothetical protein